MINRYIYGKAIYIEEVFNQENIEHEREIIIYEDNVYRETYYSNLNRGIQLSKMVKIKEHYKYNWNNGELRYIEIDNKRYKITKLNQSKQRNVIVDLEELK